LEHEKSQLDQHKLIVDRKKTTLDNSVIGRWISISWHRTTDYIDFFAYDVGVIADVKNGKVFVNYNDDGVFSVSLNSRGWNYSSLTHQKMRKIGACLKK
jgi:hypothetical protein